MCSRLNNFYSKLKEFHETERYVDVSIECGGQIFHCHRIILAIASNYFHAMFLSNFSERTPFKVILQDVDANTFKQVLSFFYTGNVIVNSANVNKLLRVSNLMSLPTVEQQCMKFVKRKPYLLTVENILEIFDFACVTGRNDLKRIMIVHMAKYLDIIHRANLFLQIPIKDLIEILNQYTLMSIRNKGTFLRAVLEWVLYKLEERFQYLDKIGKITCWANISLEVTKLITEMVTSVSSPVPVQWQKIVNSPSDDDAEIARILKAANFKSANLLHVYVRYEDEKIDRIFSINNTGQCTIFGEIPIISNMKFGFNNISTWNFPHLCCLNICDRHSKSYSSDFQKFFAFTSVDRHSEFASLTPPPVVLESMPAMCHVPILSSIFLYRKFWFDNDTLRTNSSNSKIFSNEDINRGIYAYNCDLDQWFPVACPKKVLKFSSIASCDHLVYLIGGQSETFFQAYDVRTKGWQELPGTLSSCTDAGCCTLDGKIYVCGDSMQRYDIVASKWEAIASTDAELDFQQAISYSGKMWVMEQFDATKNDLFWSHKTNRELLSLNIYDTSLNKWSTSSMIADLAMEVATNSDSTLHIMDCVVSTVG